MPKNAQKKLQRRPGSLLLPKRLHMMPIVLQKRLQLSKPQRKRLLKKPSALKRRLLLKKPLNKLLPMPKMLKTHLLQELLPMPELQIHTSPHPLHPKMTNLTAKPTRTVRQLLKPTDAKRYLIVLLISRRVWLIARLLGHMPSWKATRTLTLLSATQLSIL